MAKKFEYKIVTPTEADDDPETLLNELGDEGYELVSVHVSEVTYVETGDGDGDEEDEGGEEYVEEVVTYYFKREKE